MADAQRARTRMMTVRSALVGVVVIINTVESGETDDDGPHRRSAICW